MTNTSIRTRIQQVERTISTVTTILTTFKLEIHTMYHVIHNPTSAVEHSTQAALLVDEIEAGLAEGLETQAALKFMLAELRADLRKADAHEAIINLNS